MDSTRYRSIEAETVYRVGLHNPIVCATLSMWERDECSWEQALVAMVAHLAVAYASQHDLLLEAMRRQPPRLEQRTAALQAAQIEGEPFDSLEFAKGQMMILPEGWTMKQIEADEQPERVSADGKRTLPDNPPGYCIACGGEHGEHKIGCKK